MVEILNILQTSMDKACVVRHGKHVPCSARIINQEFNLNCVCHWFLLLQEVQAQLDEMRGC